jgi:predicted Rossmann fold flavoprotein
MHDLIVIGAGAAGLMTAITAKKAGVPSVLLLDSKEKIGAKILMSGGTRCNLTNQTVTDKDFQTQQKNILRSVLQYFPSEKAVAFFMELGIDVVIEEGGKYFPSTHSGRTVLEVLQKEIKNRGIDLETGKKVTGISFKESHFTLSGKDFSYDARCVVLTTGGLSFPATGSDGSGYQLAAGFGHRILETFPSLTPLKSADGALKSLAGITLPAHLTLRVKNKKAAEYQGSFLFTHFGFSGPVVLNISRHWIAESIHENAPEIEACFLLHEPEEKFQARLMHEITNRPGRHLRELLNGLLPQRFVEVIFNKVGIDPYTVFNQLTKDQRNLLLKYLYRHPLEITGSLGYEKAEVTAGGIDLAEVDRKTLESKLRPGLFFAGEILDVDGRIGGFNFQWAWSSGVVAGLGASEKVKFLKNKSGLQ